MRAKRRQRLIVKVVRFSNVADDVSRRKIAEVYRLLLNVGRGSEQDAKKGKPPRQAPDGEDAPTGGAEESNSHEPE